MAAGLEDSGVKFKGKLQDQQDDLNRAAQSLRVLAQTLEEGMDFTYDRSLVSTDVGKSGERIVIVASDKEETGHDPGETKEQTPRALTFVQLKFGGTVKEEEAPLWQDPKNAQGNFASSLPGSSTSSPLPASALATKMLKIAASLGMSAGYAASATSALSKVHGIALSLDEVLRLASNFWFSSTHAERTFTPYG